MTSIIHLLGSWKQSCPTIMLYFQLICLITTFRSDNTLFVNGMHAVTT